MSTDLEPGDRLRDNDPRRSHRAPLTVTDILPNGVVVEDSRGRAFGLLRHRIFTDGKARRYGFNKIED